MNGLLNLAEVAVRLGCSRTTAWRLVASGVIPSVRLTKTLRRVDPVDLERFIEERREVGGQPVGANVVRLSKSHSREVSP